MKLHILIALAGLAAGGDAVAKLPVTPADPVKAEEAKKKAADIAKKDADDLAKAQDRTVAHYKKGQGKAVQTSARK